MKIAFVYDRINKIGGAERILVTLHEIWPQAPFFTAVYNPESVPFSKNWEVHTSFLQHLPLAKTNHELYPWLTPFAFESFSFSDFDVVISITSAEAKGIITRPETLHICYCLTPTRYLWSHADEYLRQSHALLQPIHRLFLTKLRAWDQVASSRPDYYLAISQTVKQRLHKYYHRDSTVIYPGIDTNFFKPAAKDQRPASPARFAESRRAGRLKTNDYFLVVSRLVAYKHLDLAVKACNELHLPLKIIGTGQELSRLRQLAGPTIQFLGQLTDGELVGYYQSCRALIFPGEEDLGLTMLEAQAVGKPVIAYRGGGATEVINQQTGIFFDKLSVSSLKDALGQFIEHQFKPEIIRHQAQKFATIDFKHRFKQLVEDLWQKHQQRQ